MSTAPADRAATLVEALPYIRRFADQVVVVKYGGNALAGASDIDALALFAEDIVLMRQVGMRPVVVHGGGPQISDLMSRLGKQSEFRHGLRVTDGETVDRPAVSGRPSATFAAWMAPPEAPLARLSIAQMAMTVLVRSSNRAVIWATLLPIVALVDGDAGRTTMNGSPR